MSASEYKVIIKRPVVVEDWLVAADSEDDALRAVMNGENRARLLVSDAAPAEVDIIHFRSLRS